MFIDTHAHLNFPRLLQNLEPVLLDCDSNRVSKVVVPSVDRESWMQIFSMSASYRQIFPACGLHPVFVEKHSLCDIESLKEFVESHNIVAIGEIGLDKRVADYSKQLALFESQLEIAERFELPVILHCVRAHEDLLSSLAKYNLVGGVIHAFSGSEELLHRYVDMGLYIGVGGVITRVNAKKVRRAISKAPLGSLVLETDSPDMAVGGKVRGESSPADTLDVFRALCSLRDEPPEVLERVIWDNSLSLFPGIED